ncbi:MAG: hypothetical protein GY851_30390 [bacterium]|nr:hypothetical protein [bacterium]
MKYVLEFDGTEGEEHQQAVNGWLAFGVIHDWSETLRQHRKYQDLDERFGSPSEYHAHLEALWNERVEDLGNNYRDALFRHLEWLDEMIRATPDADRAQTLSTARHRLADAVHRKPRLPIR